MARLGCVPRPLREERLSLDAPPSTRPACPALCSCCGRRGLLIQPHGPQEVPGLWQQTRSAVLPLAGNAPAGGNRVCLCQLRLLTAASPPLQFPSLPLPEVYQDTGWGHRQFQNCRQPEEFRYLLCIFRFGFRKKHLWEQLHS